MRHFPAYSCLEMLTREGNHLRCCSNCQRIGRIKGNIVMLVTLRNAHEPGTHDVAEKLLHILSSNPQNVLLMAEAGYFRPLIHYLKEGILIFSTLRYTNIYLICSVRSSGTSVLQIKVYKLSLFLYCKPFKKSHQMHM